MGAPPVLRRTCRLQGRGSRAVAPDAFEMDLEGAAMSAMRRELEADKKTTPEAQADLHLAAFRLTSLRTKLDGLWPEEE